jgi:hypothetical protein
MVLMAMLLSKEPDSVRCRVRRGAVWPILMSTRCREDTCAPNRIAVVIAVFASKQSQLQAAVFSHSQRAEGGVASKMMDAWRLGGGGEGEARWRVPMSAKINGHADGIAKVDDEEINHGKQGATEAKTRCSRLTL